VGPVFAPGYVAVVAGGDVSDDLLPLVKGASSVMAVDSGAHFLKRHDMLPSVLLGDFDSCDLDVVEHFRRNGVKVLALERDKDRTDTQAALDLACEEGFKQAVVLGALGGRRPEHSIANLFLLEAYAGQGLDVVLASKDTVVSGVGGRGKLSHRSRIFRGEKGDWVSLFSVTTEAAGVTTSGLRFPLKDAVLRRGATLGTSNEMTGDEASVSIEEGFLLVVETRGSQK